MGTGKLRLQNRAVTKGPAANKMFMQLRGVVLAIKIGFLISSTHGGQFRRWSGLTFRYASFLSPPIPATA